MDVVTVPKGSPSKSSLENAADKRRRKAESLLHSSKQKLNIAIAEASAAEHAPLSSAGLPSNGNVQPETKRPLKIYDTLEEFERNLPSTVTILNTPFGSKVYLVGTAHFSEESQDDVSFVSIINESRLKTYHYIHSFTFKGYTQCPSRCCHGRIMYIPYTNIKIG